MVRTRFPNASKERAPSPSSNKDAAVIAIAIVLSMASFQWNYEAARWDKVRNAGVKPNTYILREVPGDEAQYKEIPASVSLADVYEEGNSILITSTASIQSIPTRPPQNTPSTPRRIVREPNALGQKAPLQRR
jgi:hypothetical protein